MPRHWIGSAEQVCNRDREQLRQGLGRFVVFSAGEGISHKPANTRFTIGRVLPCRQGQGERLRRP
jgi:hypothetical protein